MVGDGQLVIELVRLLFVFRVRVVRCVPGPTLSLSHAVARIHWYNQVNGRQLSDAMQVGGREEEGGPFSSPLSLLRRFSFVCLFV